METVCRKYEEKHELTKNSLNARTLRGLDALSEEWKHHPKHYLIIPSTMPTVMSNQDMRELKKLEAVGKSQCSQNG